MCSSLDSQTMRAQMRKPGQWWTICCDASAPPYSISQTNQSQEANLSMSVCLSLKYLCRSGSDWPEILNMVAAWFKDVQIRICLDYNDTVNKLFHKLFANSASIVNHSKHSNHSHVCTLTNKRNYTFSGASWAGSLPAVQSRYVHLNWLLWINETEWVPEESVKQAFVTKVSASRKYLQKNTFLLVQKATTPTNHKMIWQNMWFGCWGMGEVVGRAAVKEWQQ